MILDKRVLFRPLRNSRRINIGGGKWYARRWENVDFYAPWPYSDVRLDLRDRPALPYNSRSCDVVYCSHVLEHLPDAAVRHVLGEIARLLKIDGLVRLVVPDMDRALDAYRLRNEEFFDHGGVRCVGPTLEHKLVNYFASYWLDEYRGGPDVVPATVQQLVSSIDKHAFVAWCAAQIPHDAELVAHLNGFDFDKLSQMAAQAGLRLERSVFRGSALPELRGPAFDHLPAVSLYVEGGIDRRALAG